MEEEGKRRGGGGEVEKDGERVSDTILVSTLVITTQNRESACSSTHM